MTTNQRLGCEFKFPKADVKFPLPFLCVRPNQRVGLRSASSRGQSLLEFALVLPLLLIVVAGVLDLGRVFFATIQVTNAAREGVRYLTRHPDDIGGAIDAAENEAQIDVNVSVTCPDVEGDGCDSGGKAIVTLTHEFKFVLGFILPSSIPISRDATMVVP